LHITEPQSLDQLGREQRARREEQSARQEVERELGKARVDLKRESEHLRMISEQDRMHRERTEMARRKFKELIDAMETVYGMGKEVIHKIISPTPSSTPYSSNPRILKTFIVNRLARRCCRATLEISSWAHAANSALT